MSITVSIKQMIKEYEQKLRNTNNISMRDIIEQIIEDLTTLLNIAEIKK